MPLTIEKIEPDSPAKRAGLLNGDTILTINGEEAIDMSLAAASRRVEGAGHSLTVGVVRGLYDPVLHDFEPIYDYEPDDSGRQSEPTEVVFEIQKFVEPSDIGSQLLELGDSPNQLSESRSLTASPYVTPTKPYRPFSTEPIVEIPPLEDPIILNPNYRDQFGKSPIDNDPDYLLSPFNRDALGPNRYKLPISEQYDPDGTRFKQSTEVVEKLLKYEKHVKSLSKDLEVVDVTKETKVCDTAVERKASMSKDVSFKESLIEDVKSEKKGVRISEESVRRESKSFEKKEMFKEEIEEESIREELQYIEKMRQEIDLEKIEETAMSVVDASIERAVSVAEEIKKEIDEELSSSEQQEKSEVKYEKREESSEVIDKTESKQETKEYAERKMSREERTETQDATQRIARKDVQQTESSEQFETEHGKMDVHRKSLVTEEYKQEYLEEPRQAFSREGSESRSEAKLKFKKAAKTVASSVKGEKTTAEQRAYTIGLQTIPNIRGTVHSSYHYDLLLRTFFIHLTDVMVALSRFLLTQPVFNQLEQSLTESRYESGERDTQVRKSSHVVEKDVMKAQEAKKVETKQTRQLITPVPVEKKAVSQKIEKDVKIQEQKIEKDVKIQEQKIEKKEIMKPVPVKAEQIQVQQEQKIEQEMMVSEKKSGAEMAQRSEKKLTKEMTQKLGAVISEFQTIAVEDAKEQMLMKSRRSRSRSQIEEEVAKESDPLEWLSKVDSRRTSQEKMEMSKTEFSSEKIEKKSFVETKEETVHKKPKPPKQTYIAIVESHVYTNKDAIFEEHVTDISETSSVQSAEEINTAFEAVETVSAENVAIESAVRQLETAKIVEETHKLDKVVAKSAAVVQKHEEVIHDTKELVQEEVKKETAVQKTDIQEVIVQETKEIVEPVVEIKESKVEKVEKVAIDINKSLAIAESTEVSMLESAIELKEEKQKVEKVAIDVNESLAIAESAEVTTLESKAEFKDVEVKAETVAIIEEEKIEEKVIETKPEVLEAPKPVEVVEITETIKLKPKDTKTVHDESAELKIVKIVPVDSVLSPEIIEVEDISELISKSVISQVAVGDQISIDASKEVSATSSITEKSSKSGKKESAADVSSAVSQVSSQSEASAVSKELSVSQKLESTSQSSETQEASFTAKSVDRKLSLRTDLDRQTSVQSPPSSIDTPTPSTVPPTPVTDEYVFKLSLPLPKSRSATPVPRDSTPTPDDEDPNIVKKKLIPHIETTIERVVYDPPLPTPTTDPQSPVFTKPVLNGGGIKPVYSKPGLKGGAVRPVYIKPGLRGGGIRPVYRKPGLFGGADNQDYSKEEIREIERKSSLLASAIDETIKSIEEYKEEVGIDTKKEVKTQEFKEEKITKSYKESYSKEVKTESIQNGFQEIDTKIDEIMEQCNALVSIADSETPKITENETQGIVTEVDEKESRKQSVEIDVKIETEPSDEKSKEKSVKFENEVKIVEVEIIDEKIPEVEKKESIRVDIPVEKEPAPVAEPVPIILDPVPPTPVVEKQPEELLQPRVVPEVPVVQAPVRIEEEKKPDPLLGFRPVVFDPENLQRQTYQYPFVEEPMVPQEPRGSPYMSETGEIIGTIQGIVDGLETPVMDEEVAKELGKPGISEEKIATLISGEAEMLREAHVMGLSRVLSSHMHRADDSSVDFQVIKPMIGTLKDSEVIKALNEEIAREKAEQKKKEEKRWTTFLQKPKRPVPKAKFGYQGWTQDEEVVAEPYKVKIVKQAKPKVAPDYKPEDFETGPLPWEERAHTEASLPPVEPEEPILIPEVPEFLEAVDPLKESEVPDLEDTGIPLPPPREPTPPPIVVEQPEPEPIPEEPEEEVAPEEQKVEKTETKEDMENRMAEQLVRSVQSMVDPNASLDQQLAQMRAQLAALAQLPEVIQQSLELVSKQLSKISHQEAHVEVTQESQNYQQAEETHEMQTIQEVNESEANETQNEAQKMIIEEVRENNVEQQQQMQQQQMQQMQQQQMQQQQESMRMTEEEIRNEKQRKEQERIEHESRMVKQHPTPRSAKPKRVFGPLDPEERMAVVLPGGRRWKNSKDVYDEQMIKEMFEQHSEVIKGNAIGINFMKYEKPPVSLDHLKHSEVYKLVHDMDTTPPRKVEMRTPVMSEADYRERCRSMTPNVEKKHLQIPQQFHP
nr:titin homolog isoform X1 [Helicoverpa armigera]